MEEVYPIIFIAATHFHVRNNGQIVKKAAYVVLGIGYTNLLELDEKWKSRYPGAIQSWIDNWEVLSVFFKFSAEIKS